MGFLVPGTPPFDFEEGSDSFTIHPDDRFDALYARWATTPHPEFAWRDLDALIEGLTFLRDRKARGEDGHASELLLARCILSSLAGGEKNFAELKADLVATDAASLAALLDRLVSSSQLRVHTYGGIDYYSV